MCFPEAWHVEYPKLGVSTTGLCRQILLGLRALRAAKVKN